MIHREEFKSLTRSADGNESDEGDDDLVDIEVHQAKLSNDGHRVLRKGSYRAAYIAGCSFVTVICLCLLGSRLRRSTDQPVTVPSHGGQQQPQQVTPLPLISSSIKKEHEKWSKELHRISKLDRYPKNREPDVHWEWHPRERSARFPSVEERIEYYMGKWFNSTIPLQGKDFRKQTFIYQKTTREYQTHATIPVNLYGLSRKPLYKCYKNDPSNARDCLDTIDLAILHSEGTTNVLQHLGDGVPVLRTEADRLYPIFNKVRLHCTLDPVTNKFFNPKCDGERPGLIVWPLTRMRHFTPTIEVPSIDIPWDKKKPVAMWRGGLHVNTHGHPSAALKWNLVANHVNSTMVDAKFGVNRKSKKIKEMEISDDFLSDYTSMEQQLTNRYLISIDGNDVSTGLKWMLFSKSLLFLPGLGFESWAMEGLLKPFEHFVPINSDASNVEEMVNWAESNPEKAQQIAERGSLFIYDLLYHPDALRDEELVLQGMMERFEQNFGFSSMVSRVHPLFVHLDWHPKNRDDRFPSVDQRVEYYMGKWYHKHVSMEREGFSHPVSEQEGPPELGKEMVANGKLLVQCASGKGDFSDDLVQFCDDALPDFDERTTTDLKANVNEKQLHHTKLAPEGSISGSGRIQKRLYFDDSVKIVRFGDGTTDWTSIPVFVKGREAASEKDVRGPAILWQFDYNREFGLVQSGLVEQMDDHFDSKDARAVWRGGLGTTGKLSRSTEFKHRRDLVQSSVRTFSQHVDALFLGTEDWLLHQNNSEEVVSEDMVDSSAKKDDDGKYFMRHALSYRYIISTEDDFRINSDLKWMLLSQSVVFMPQDRRFTSWFMEDLLEPYVHYVPIASDYSNVEDQVNWCNQHPHEARKISERATLFVHDMLFHRKSDHDNSEVKFRIMERYAEKFNK